MHLHRMDPSDPSIHPGSINLDVSSNHMKANSNNIYTEKQQQLKKNQTNVVGSVSATLEEMNDDGIVDGCTTPVDSEEEDYNDENDEDVLMTTNNDIFPIVIKYMDEFSLAETTEEEESTNHHVSLKSIYMYILLSYVSFIFFNILR